MSALARGTSQSIRPVTDLCCCWTKCRCLQCGLQMFVIMSIGMIDWPLELQTITCMLLRVLAHSLSVNLLLLFPRVIFIYAGQQVLLGESTYREWRLEVDRISRNTPSPFCTSQAVLHGYRGSLEADILYIIFVSLRVCHNIEFLLNSILLFYSLTLPREL